MRKNHLAGMLAVSAFVIAMGATPLARAEGAGQYISDAAITTKVKAELLTDSQLKATQVSVETDHGVVHLTGTVNNTTQESQAVSDANKIDGVKSVKDQLTVSTTEQD